MTTVAPLWTAIQVVIYLTRGAIRRGYQQHPMRAIINDKHRHLYLNQPAYYLNLHATLLTGSWHTCSYYMMSKAKGDGPKVFLNRLMHAIYETLYSPQGRISYIGHRTSSNPLQPRPPTRTQRRYDPKSKAYSNARLKVEICERQPVTSRISSLLGALWLFIRFTLGHLVGHAVELCIRVQRLAKFPVHLRAVGATPGLSCRHL